MKFPLPTVAFAAAIIASLFGSIGASAQQEAKTGMPSIIQLDFGPFGSHLPGDGQDYCYPTSATMLFFWLGANGYTQLAPAYSEGAALNLDAVFGGLMQTSATGGTYNSGYTNGLDIYLQAEGVSESNWSWNISSNPSLQWFAGNNGPDTVTLAALSWYQQTGTNPDVYYYNGGHGTALVDADTNASTLTVNNPYPSTFLNVPNTPGQNPMTVNIQQVPANWILKGDTNTPYIQVSTPILGPTPPNTGSPGGLGVYDTGIALTLNPVAQPANPSYSLATWTITNTQTVNTGGGNLPVIAPLADGSSPGGLDKEGDGTLMLENSNSLTGSNQINGGTISSTETSAHCANPFGYGSVTISGHGFLEFQPDDSSPAPMNFTLASGSSQSLTVDGGAGMIILDRGNNPSMSVTIGGSTNGVGQNIQLADNGTLALSVPTALSDLGSQVQVFTAGGAGNAPAMTNGMVTPAIVALRSADSDPAAFLSYSPSKGFSVAATTSGDINGSDSTAIYAATTNQLIASNAAVYALIVNKATISGGTLGVGSPTGGDAGIIFNGGSISSALQYGADNAYVYSSATGGTLAGAISGTGTFTAFGPGTLTLSGDSSATQSGNLIVNSGTLEISSNGVTGTGGVTVQNDANLLVAGTVTGAVSLSNSATITLQGGTLQGGVTVGSSGTLQGSGTISGAAAIHGVLQASSLSAPGNLTFDGPATFGDKSQFFWTLNSLTTNTANAGIAWNTLTFNNTTTFAGSDVTFFLNIPDAIDPDSTNTFWNSNESWVIATGTNEAFLENDGISVENWDWDSGSFELETMNNNSALVLEFTAVPEPAEPVLLLVTLGICTAFMIRKRRDVKG